MEWFAAVIVLLLIVLGIPFSIGMLVGFFVGRSKGRKQQLPVATLTMGAVPYPPQYYRASTPQQGGPYQQPTAPANYHQAPPGNTPMSGPPPQAPSAPFVDTHQPSPQNPPQLSTPNLPPQHPTPNAPAYPYAAYPAGTAPAVDTGPAMGSSPAVPSSPPPSGAPTEARVINIALYLGGLLITAAALSFVAVTQNPVITAVALIASYLVFAVVGFVLSTTVTVLRPAGLALFGTSLALLAVAAVPVDQAFIQHPTLTWWIFSLAGLLVYSAAAIRLDSRVLGYLAIPFLYSMIFSSTAVLQPALIWTLVAIVGLSTVVQLAVLALGNRIPAILSKPFGQLHWIVVPGVVIAGILSAFTMSALEYAALFAVAAAHYVVSAILATTASFRAVYALTAHGLMAIALTSLLVGLQMPIAPIVLLVTVWVVTAHVLLSTLFKLPAVATDTTGLVVANVSASLVILVGIVAQLILLVNRYVGPPVTTGDHLWMVGVLLVLAGFAAHQMYLQPHHLYRDIALRSLFGLSILVPLATHPIYSLAWLLVWIIAEFGLGRGDRLRGAWQRLLVVAWCATLGWSVGDFTDDVVLGLRLGLLALFASAALAIVHRVLRVHAARLPGEATMWTILLPIATIGISASAGSWWWVELIVAVLLIGVTIFLLVKARPLRETPLAAVLHAAVGTYLLIAVLLTTAFEGHVIATVTGVSYLACTVAFLATLAVTLNGRGAYQRDITAQRGSETVISAYMRTLMISGAVVGIAASVLPMLTAAAGTLGWLSWVVPVMHTVVTLMALRYVPATSRHAVALVSSLMLPLSGLFALWQMQVTGAELFSGTVLMMVALLLVTEAILGHGQTATSERTPQWGHAFYVTAGSLATLLTLVAVFSSTLLTQLAPLVGAVLLVVAGLIRGRWTGFFWGAVLVVLTVLWTLRDALYGMLIVLGLVVIGVAIWRLIVMQRRTQHPDRTG